MDKEVLRLARSIGVNVEDPEVVRVLERERVVAEEAGLILERSRHALNTAYFRGSIPTEERDHGKYAYRTARVIDVLEWAVNRPGKKRWVDEARARRYAAEDARKGQ